MLKQRFVTRTRKIRWIAAIACVVLAGCGGETTPAEVTAPPPPSPTQSAPQPTATSQSISPTVQTTAAAVVTAGAKSGKVPDAIAEIETQAEDIIDAVPDGKWDQIVAGVAAINAAWKGYEKQAATDQVPQPAQTALMAAYDRLQKAAAAKDAAGTSQAANDLSMATMDIYAVFDPKLPVDIGRLVVSERQIIIDATANNLTAAADSLAKTNTIWARVKPVVMARNNGPAAAAKFDKALAAQQTALDAANAKGLADAAEQSLTQLDAVEEAF